MLAKVLSDAREVEADRDGGLLARLEAKPGKETDVADLLRSALPLANAEPGDHVRVIDVSADKLLKKRLVSMGILTNSLLHVLQRRGGAIVIGFDASRIAIGASMSQHILVRAA